jgi:hypothetical protein
MKTLLLILIAFVIYMLLPFSVSIKIGSTETPAEKRIKTYCAIKKESKKPVDFSIELV